MKTYLLQILLTLALASGLAVAGTTASAAAAIPAAGSVAAATAHVPTAWSDCTRAAGRGSNARAKVFYALADIRCSWTVVAAAGTVSADSICWMSRQWWGGPARGVVWMVTSGRYTVC